MFMPLPAWTMLPITTESTSAGSSLERRKVAAMAWAPSALVGVSFNKPPKLAWVEAGHGLFASLGAPTEAAL
jgi:hypothetical protein